jgi:hypothetical protein
MNTDLRNYVKLFYYRLQHANGENYPDNVNFIIPENFCFRWQHFHEIDDKLLLASEQVDLLFLQCISYGDEFLRQYVIELEKRFNEATDNETRDGFRLKINLVKKIIELRKLNEMKKEEKTEEENFEAMGKMSNAMQLAYLEAALKFFNKKLDEAKKGG